MSADTSGRAMVSRHAGQPTIGGAPALTRFVALGGQTERDFGLFEYTLAPRTGGASPHYHTQFSETFYVLEGILDVLDGDESVAAEAGDLIYVPRRSIHGFRNSGDNTVRFLILFTPGVAREDYFAGNAERRSAGITLSQEDQDAFAALHDQYNVH